MYLQFIFSPGKYVVKVIIVSFIQTMNKIRSHSFIMFKVNLVIACIIVYKFKNTLSISQTHTNINYRREKKKPGIKLYTKKMSNSEQINIFKLIWRQLRKP